MEFDEDFFAWRGTPYDLVERGRCYKHSRVGEGQTSKGTKRVCRSKKWENWRNRDAAFRITHRHSCASLFTSPIAIYPARISRSNSNRNFLYKLHHKILVRALHRHSTAPSPPDREKGVGRARLFPRDFGILLGIPRLAPPIPSRRFLSLLSFVFANQLPPPSVNRLLPPRGCFHATYTDLAAPTEGS